MIPAFVSAALAVALVLPVSETAIARAKPVMPIFEVDHTFPKLPDDMLFGGVGGATADSHGNVWVFHRQHTLEEGTSLDQRVQARTAGR